ncbi:hypothetical protein pb186bvf_012309 [Paramecium bursaria]
MKMQCSLENHNQNRKQVFQQFQKLESIVKKNDILLILYNLKDNRIIGEYKLPQTVRLLCNPRIYDEENMIGLISNSGARNLVLFNVFQQKQRVLANIEQHHHQISADQEFFKLFVLNGVPVLTQVYYKMKNNNLKKVYMDFTIFDNKVIELMQEFEIMENQRIKIIQIINTQNIAIIFPDNILIFDGTFNKTDLHMHDQFEVMNIVENDQCLFVIVKDNLDHFYKIVHQNEERVIVKALKFYETQQIGINLKRKTISNIFKRNNQYYLVLSSQYYDQINTLYINFYKLQLQKEQVSFEILDGISYQGQFFIFQNDLQIDNKILYGQEKVIKEISF